jgi:hypothetical protein
MVGGGGDAAVAERISGELLVVVVFLLLPTAIIFGSRNLEGTVLLIPTV